MKETKFIDQNKEKWRDFETIITSEDKDPDKLSRLFVQVTDDLSYSRTFYPNRMVRVYLNTLAQRVFSSLYKNKKANFSRFMYFWSEELPYQVWNARKALLLSLIVFITSVVIGVISSINDPSFAGHILSDYYVEKTKDNIEEGDPMKVYKSDDRAKMFLHISLNNLQVAFLTFISGVVAAIGSLYVLLVNGIMVGAFQYFFYERGLFWESFLTIWMHGTIEISCIVIAGGAGLVMGSGLLFPGTLTRLQSFQASAKRGLKIMVGIAPLIVYAAIIETFLTRYTEIPDFLKVIFISVSALFVLGYFVILPIRKRYYTGFMVDSDEYRKLPASKEEKLEIGKKVKSLGEVFRDLIVMIKLDGLRLFQLNLGLGALYCLVMHFIFQQQLKDSNLSSDWIFNMMGLMLDFREHPELLLVNTVFSTVIVFVTLSMLLARARGQNFAEAIDFRFILINVPKVLIVMAFLYGLFWLHFALGLIISIMLIPLLALWVYTSMAEGSLFLGASINRAGKLQMAGLGQSYLLHIMLGFLFFILLIFTTSPLLVFYWDALKNNLALEQEEINYVFRMMALGIFFLTFQFGLFVLFLGNAMNYHSMREIIDAEGLLERINAINSKTNKLAGKYAK